MFHKFYLRIYHIFFGCLYIKENQWTYMVASLYRRDNNFCAVCKKPLYPVFKGEQSIYESKIKS